MIVVNRAKAKIRQEKLQLAPGRSIVVVVGLTPAALGFFSGASPTGRKYLPNVKEFLGRAWVVKWFSPPLGTRKEQDLSIEVTHNS